MASGVHERMEPATERGRPMRPSFSSSITSDRLRECERRPSIPATPKMEPRKSVFREEKLDDLTSSVHDGDLAYLPPMGHDRGRARSRKFEEISGDADQENENAEEGGKKSGSGNRNWLARIARPTRPVLKTTATAPPGAGSWARVAMIAMLVAVVVPGFRNSGREGTGMEFSGADAGVIPVAELVENASAIEGRANSPTSVCTRWSHQTANVNGTVYIYGGQVTQTSGQTANTWNNNFLKLDLTKTWGIASPPLTGLPQSSGPPPVALGSLWHSYDTLWLYGGMFSDNPSTSPLPVSTWEYNIKSTTWTEHLNPQTLAGNYSDGGNMPVQRAAEGAGLSVPELGRSWYFGGHLDLYTTPGWSNQIARVYLKSLLEFTHPGYANTGVTSLGTKTAAGIDGVYRNITQGGVQDENGFTERADGVLVYVPGWGEEGIVLGLAGGTNATFTEMNVIDIYDVANSTWYKQPTSGPSPPYRVDPCAVVAAASDGTSFNIYLYGGQSLLPFGSQTQYSDMYILTIPSFTWVQVNMDGQPQPPARAGHSCVMWDGQMVVIGGYVGKDISCDSPGVYVFNASSLLWGNTFNALASKSTTNTQGSSVLQGSVGYQVPAAVQSIIGGNSAGGATATQPAAGPAASGPIATGKPPTFTVTQSGSAITSTAHSTSTVSPGPSNNYKSKNTGAIIAGAIAGVLAVLVAYLAFCTWLYRRQLQLYKNHVAMAQRTSFNMSLENGETGNADEKLAGGSAAFLGPFGTEISPSHTRPSGSDSGRITDSSGITPSSGEYVGAAGMSKTHSPFGRGSEGGSGAGSGEWPGDGRAERPESWGGRASTGHSSIEDLLGGLEPSFFSVMLNPRRTLRVVNLD